MSYDLQIHSNEGIGPLRLGMSITEVRKAIRLEVRSFKKNLTSVMPTDVFDELGLHVYYKAPGICEAIEVGRPGNPTFKGQLLIGRPYSEVLDFIRGFDPIADEDGAGLTSKALGISIYAPGARKNPDDPVEGIMVFADGYYD